jgi:hypothetical protein
VVNEVMSGGAESASEELVEVTNPCAVPLALEGARLLYQSASGATQRTLVTWEAGLVLAPGARLLYATSLFPGPTDGSFSSGLSGTGGGVAVVDAGGALVDGVGYGTATNDFVEGSVAAAPAAGSVIARIPDGIRSRISPIIPVPFGILPRGARLDKPGMLIGAVIGYKVEDDFNVSVMRFTNQAVHIGQSTEQGVNVFIITDIITKIGHRRRITGGNPNGVDPQPGQVVQSFNDAGQVANTVAVAVLVAAGINLVNNGLLPPIVHG